MRLRFIAPDPDRAKTEIDRAFAVEANSCKSRAGTAQVQQPLQSDFFHRYGMRAAERGALRLAFLEFGDRPAAVHYGVVLDNIFWSLRIGHDERFTAVSPGELLMLELIGECVAQGFSRLELCGKDADWTRRWTPQSRPIAAVRLYPPTLRGVTGMVRDVGGLGLRLARARLARKVE